MVLIRLQPETFSPGAEADEFFAGTSEAGALVTFTGVMRSSMLDPVISMEIEHYPQLAKGQMTELAETAVGRFGLVNAGIIHRHGMIFPGEPIMQVMTSAAHRAEAFAAAEYLMDWLKTEAPFWKNETRPDGTRWVQPRPADDEARMRWVAAGNLM